MSYFNGNAPSIVSKYAHENGLDERDETGYCYQISDWSIDHQIACCDLLYEQAMGDRRNYLMTEIACECIDIDTAINLFNPVNLGPMLARCALVYLGDELNQISAEACLISNRDRALDQADHEAESRRDEEALRAWG